MKRGERILSKKKKQCTENAQSQRAKKYICLFSEKANLNIAEIYEGLLGLFMCVFGVSIAVYLPATESIVYKYFISIAQSRNMEYWKLTHNCNIVKQEGDKIQTENFFWILFMSVFTGKSIKNKRFVWDFKECQNATGEMSR